jgi:hypothetical protein
MLPPGDGRTEVVTPNLVFGNAPQEAFDFGDAPDPTYPTLLINNGARHLLTPALKLGALIDTEPNGLPNATATGDNLNNLNDEDGVTFTSLIQAGSTATVNVSVMGNGGFLNAWIDFNRDGDWNDPGEQIFTNKAVVNGVNSLSFTVPTGAIAGDTFTRFRLSTQQNLATTGQAPDGEVEDYKVTIGCVDGPIGGINLGTLPNYLFFFANGSQDANWQGATKGFAGDVAVNGQLANERTSGSVPYAGTIYTNDSTLGAWQNIVNQNSGQAFASTGKTALISELTNQLNAAFSQINGLTATPGYTSVSATSLNGLNTQDGIAKTYVINVTSGFQVSSQINITGDVNDVFVLRWDTDANFTNGYQGQVKFQSGGAIVPKGGLTAGNFIHVAGDIDASGGGSTPPPPYPQGPRFDDGKGALINGGSNFSGGGFFTGYWLTTGDPSNGDTSSLSNAIFTGGWYTLSDKFSMTSGTSGVHVCPPPGTNPPGPNLAGLGDFVWNDLNRNGIQDPGEPGINGATVKLQDAAGNTLATTTTGDNPNTPAVEQGYYAFNNLAPGTYKVMFVQPNGFSNVSPFMASGSTPANDSDANPANGLMSNPVTLTAGQFNSTIDAGFYNTSNFNLEIIKDANQTTVAPNTPVTFTYTVRNTGVLPLSNIVVTDDNATPTFAADDFKPTRQADATGNNDNILDVGEVWKYSATVIPPLKMTVTTSTGATPLDSGVLSFQPLDNGDVRVYYRQSNNFNDNTYGTGSDAGWTSQGKTHTFNNLVGSDKAGFLVKYSDGTTLVQFYQDYISASGTASGTYSGYQSLGYSGGDGRLISGNGAVLKDFDSTLELNLNQPGIANNGVAYTAMTVNSPTNGVNNPLPTDPKWDVVDGYYFTIDKSAFTAGKSFGGVTIFDQHNSPAKTGGSNTYVPDIVGGASVNTATVTGINGSTTVTSKDDALVNITGVNPPSSANLCDLYGKPKALRFDYEPGDIVLTGGKNNNQDGKAQILVQGPAEDDGTSYVIVSDKDKLQDILNGNGKRYFQGDVLVGNEFTASVVNANTDKFESNTYIYFFDDNPFDHLGSNQLLQEVAYLTSCSQPMQINDIIGNATLTGYLGETGSFPSPFPTI